MVWIGGPFEGTSGFTMNFTGITSLRFGVRDPLRRVVSRHLGGVRPPACGVRTARA